MSHSSHRKAARDATRPIDHRASHARSCALHVANRLGIKRDKLIEIVRERTGSDLHNPSDANELLLALDFMEAMQSSDVA